MNPLSVFLSRCTFALFLGYNVHERLYEKITIAPFIRSGSGVGILL